jgi:cyclic pyranopterin phosphate synthase
MQDDFGRTINYLRLSITDRCNLRCRYCMPAEGIQQCSHQDILSYEDCLKIVRAATELGVSKVRITGGEPLVRKGVVPFLAEIASRPGIEDVALTTNGVLLAAMAGELKAAGVKRVNVSLDSLQHETFARMTRGGSLNSVLNGLKSAAAIGLKIKLNMVVMRGFNDNEVLDFAELSQKYPWSIRYIEYMPTIREPGWREQLVSGEEVLIQLRERYSLSPLNRDASCGPAQPYRIAGAPGTIGVITPISEHFCGSCNRIRVTSTGQAKSCLLNDEAVDLKPYLSGDIEKLRQVLEDVITRKPARYETLRNETANASFSMAQIGG